MQNVNIDFFHKSVCYIEEVRKNRIVYGLKTKYGSGSSSIYGIIPGLYLCFNNLNIKGLLRDNKFTFSSPVIEIDYCLEGQWIASRLGKWDRAVRNEEGRTFFFAGTENYDTVNFGDNPYRSLSLVCCQDQMSCLPGNILGLTTKKLQKFYENTFKQGKMETLGTGASALSLIDTILKSIQDDDSELIKLRVLELFLQEIRNMETPDEVLTRRYYRDTIEKVKLIKKALDRNPHRHIPVKVLARQFGVGETTLKGCFKSVYSMGIYTYLRKLRIQIACERLENSEDSILNIANQVGYTNPSKFSSAFREIYGVTPLKYRKNR